MLRNDRGLINIDTQKDTSGAGVIIVVHKSLNPTVVAFSKVNAIGEVEFLLVLVTNPVTKASIPIACVYRPPRGVSYDSFLETVAHNRNRAESLIFFADFNCHLEIDCSDSREIRSLAKAVKISILDTGNSFHEHAHSWLDVVLVDDVDKGKILTKSEQPLIDFHDAFSLQFHFITLLFH